MTGLTVCVLISLALLKYVHCHKVVVKMGKKREECEVQVHYSCHVAVCPSSINAESELVSRAKKRLNVDEKHKHNLSNKAREKRGQYYTVCAYYHQAQHQRPDSG